MPLWWRRRQEQERKRNMAKKKTDKSIPSMSMYGNSISSVFTNFRLAPTAPLVDPVKREARRADPAKTRWSDLQVGDLIQQDGNLHTITQLSSYHSLERLADQTRVDLITADGKLSCMMSGPNSLLKTTNWRLVVKEPRAKVSFDKVILTTPQREAIMDAINQVHNHDLIFNQWGFGRIFEKGTAVSLLFYGPPGTGKTLTAQAIADEFDYKLTTISTAEIESSEPGQAERNIKKAFAEAEKDQKTVLLFDECDSLIHDRSHIGMILGAQVNCLLSCLETYTGIALFTTNMLGNLDPAFDRRLSLKLEFQMPDHNLRHQIWQRMFPEQAPLAPDVNLEALASVRVTGGYIKNAVLRAARKAANSETKLITHKILVDALIDETESMTQFQTAVSQGPTWSRDGGRAVVRKSNRLEVQR